MTPFLLVAAAVVVAWLMAVTFILCFFAGASWDDDDYRDVDDGFDSVVEAQIREALAVAAHARMDGATRRRGWWQ